jgi:hypothetical protein
MIYHLSFDIFHLAISNCRSSVIPLKATQKGLANQLE